MHWTEEPHTSGTLVRRRFSIQADGRSVPGVLWLQNGEDGQPRGRRPLVLVGHGGSQHKESDAVLDVARGLAGDHGYAVASIDGPVHGGRRADGGLDGDRVLADFRAMWSIGPRIPEMVADWHAVINALAGLDEVDEDAIGWFGLSMGNAYGMPVCAAEGTRIRAALLGMWGISRPGSEGILVAAKELRCPVLYQRKSEDERFTREGQEALFDAIGSADKELRVYPGLHVNPTGEQLQDGLDFLRRHLG
ncbi:MAG: alpha/beta hydrolase [Pseudomonadota bacterium]